MTPVSMAQYINQHSFTLGAGALFAVVAVLLIRDGVSRRDVIALLALGGSLAVAWAMLRPGGNAAAEGADPLEAARRSGQTTLVEFYSPY